MIACASNSELLYALYIEHSGLVLRNIHLYTYIRYRNDIYIYNIDR